MKKVLMVTGHFVPSNLVGIHRTRLLAWHLPEVGWQPEILTVDPRHYEERPDPSLWKLVPPGLKIHTVPALPVTRPRLVGDIGLRGFPFLAWKLRRLVRDGSYDLVWITLPSFYLALLGRVLPRKVPFGLDYQDPWVHAWPGSGRKYSRAWWASRSACWLEPIAVRGARMITGISEGYIRGTLERHPQLAATAVTATMPLGFTPADIEAAGRHVPTRKVFETGDGRIHLVYAGALLPQAGKILKAFLKAAARLEREDPSIRGKLKLHFIGTGRTPDDSRSFRVRPLAEAAGASELVEEIPERIPYLDVLHALGSAHGVLVVGSAEKHYSPSKAYQAVLSGRPVFGLVHPESPVAGLLEQTGNVAVCLSAEGGAPEERVLAGHLTNYIRITRDLKRQGPFPGLDSFSGNNTAGILAQAMDRVLEMHTRP
jgi:hypothetical protein